MTYHPKEVKLSWNHQMHVMRDREKGNHTIAGKGAMANKQRKQFFFLSDDREWHTDGPVVVGKYTQIRQRWLRAKIVKLDHGRHYKKRPLPCTGDDTSTTVQEFENQEIENKYKEKEEERKKDKKGEYQKRRKEKIELEQQACTNRLIPSLPLKVLLSARNKEFSYAPTIQVHFPQSN